MLWRKSSPREKGISRKLSRGIAAVCISLVCTSCGIMPVEEELPAAPVIRSYEATEYKQETVMRGDLILSKTVKCTYASAKQEKYGFSLGGMLIDKVYVSEGEQVREGTLLAELEHGDLPERISQGEYSLSVLEAREKDLPENHQLELARHETMITNMEVKIDFLMAWAQSIAEGKERKAMIDEANETLIQMMELEEQRESIEEAYERRLQEAQDAVYIARLRLQELKEELQERQIYAGISGTVTYLQKFKEGERSVKDKNFVTVADLDTVVFAVKGEDSQYFPVGTEATVLCEKKEFPAQAVEASTLGLVQQDADEPIAYLQLLQPDPSLENGARGSIEVTLDQREDVLYVNKKAVKTADGGQFVYMLDEDGLKVRRQIVTGLECGEYIEVVEGLAEGESVIID